jgi:hypothetical protein
MMVTTTSSKNTTNRAFIIGNGKSREGFDLEQLRPYGQIYGCNALYRDFRPDWLIAIDEAITKEIQESDFPKEKFIHPIMEEQFEHPEFNPFTRLRSNAGMNAMIEALRHGKRELICLGFDFMINDDLSISNLYDGTNAYGPETRTSVADNVRRVKYLDWFATKNNVAQFKMILPRQKNLKVHKMSSTNVRGMFIDQLMDYLKK